MAIERWFYHKFHHGLTLADVERYTHLFVGIQFFIIGAAVIIAPLFWLATKPWLRAALLRGDYSDELDEQGRPASKTMALPRFAKELALSFVFGCGVFGAAHWCGITLPTTNDRVQKHREAKQQQAD